MLEQLSPELKAQLPAEFIREVEQFEALKRFFAPKPVAEVEVPVEPEPAKPIIATEAPLESTVQPVPTATGPPLRKHHLLKRAAAISATLVGDPDDLLDTKQLADLLGCSTQWLYIGRCHGYGPPFIKNGPRCVRYRRDAVRDWLAARTVNPEAKRAA